MTPTETLRHHVSGAIARGEKTAIVEIPATPDKATICALLDRWIRQRPGLEFGNYGDVKAYRAELRSITKDGTQAKQLLRYVELFDGITAAQLVQAFAGSFSGRLSLTQRANGTWALDYCAGQYWPTEYRRAACAVLAGAIWDYWRENMTQGSPGSASLGDRLRRKGVHEFGRGIGARWFN